MLQSLKGADQGRFISPANRNTCQLSGNKRVRQLGSSARELGRLGSGEDDGARLLASRGSGIASVNRRSPSRLAITQFGGIRARASGEPSSRRRFVAAAGRGASGFPSRKISPGVCHDKSAAVSLNNRIHRSYSRKLVWVDTVPLLCGERPVPIAAVALKPSPRSPLQSSPGSFIAAAESVANTGRRGSVERQG